jgi:hypothetical protein
LWTISGGASRDLLATAHVGHLGGILFGLLWLAAAIHFTRRSRLHHREWLGGIGVGIMIALAWMTTFRIGSQSFDIVPVQSLSFTGPSADVLMLVLSPPGQPWDFNIGLVPGVVLGSFIAALWGRELKLEGFKDGHSMRRYIAGAVCMGFGGMLAGGCAVAGISGAAIFALTAWLALIGMWLGGGLTNWLVDRPARTRGHHRVHRQGCRAALTRWRLQAAQVLGDGARLVDRQALGNILHLSVVVGALALLEQVQLRFDVQRVLAGDTRQDIRPAPLSPWHSRHGCRPLAGLPWV